MSEMRKATQSESICRNCGANVSPLSEGCKTCEAFDRWQLAVDTKNSDELIKSISEEEFVLIVGYLRRLKERSRHIKHKKIRRKNMQEFDFSLQEIERTTRGLELTSIEAVGVLEMAKQSFIEEMFYDDYYDDDEKEGPPHG